ncbi:MAG: tetratricopeptide repeat protein [Fimbriimonadaceae bacterium]|nr:tetratricopeptide repeat protein [Fimbriimonadaceae bacterium]
MAAQEHDDRQPCPKCLALVAAGATYCPECGASLQEGTEGSDEAVYRELTQANLARTRNKPDEGIEICLGVLRRYPNNASAHVLLGDIYSDTGDLVKAAEWYEMAIDLAPDSMPAKEKLERVRDQLVSKEAAATARQLGIPQHQSHVVLYIASVATLIVLVGVASFMIGSQFTADKDEPPQRVNSPVVISGQRPAVQADNIMLPGERAILRAVKKNSKIADRIVSVSEDPREPSLTVTVKGQKDVPVELDAAAAVRDVFEAVPYRRVTVRVVVGDQIVMVADVTQDAYAAAKPLITGDDLAPFAAQVFPTPWTPSAPVTPKLGPAVGQ